MPTRPRMSANAGPYPTDRPHDGGAEPVDKACDGAAGPELYLVISALGIYWLDPGGNTASCLARSRGGTASRSAECAPARRFRGAAGFRGQEPPSRPKCEVRHRAPGPHRHRGPVARRQLSFANRHRVPNRLERESSTQGPPRCENACKCFRFYVTVLPLREAGPGASHRTRFERPASIFRTEPGRRPSQRGNAWIFDRRRPRRSSAAASRARAWGRRYSCRRRPSPAGLSTGPCRVRPPRSPHPRAGAKVAFDPADERLGVPHDRSPCSPAPGSTPRTRPRGGTPYI